MFVKIIESPSAPLVLIGAAVLGPGANKVYDFWDARREQSLENRTEEREKMLYSGSKECVSKSAQKDTCMR